MSITLKEAELESLISVGGVVIVQTDGKITNDIGSRRELFVDYFMIKKLQGADRYPMLDRARKDPVVTGKTHGLDQHYFNHILLSIESRDGGYWSAPDLVMHDISKSPEGNVVMAVDFGVEQKRTAVKHPDA